MSARTAHTVSLDRARLDRIVPRLRARPDFREERQGLRSITFECPLPPDLSVFDPEPDNGGGIRSEHFGSFAGTRALYDLLTERDLRPSLSHTFPVAIEQAAADLVGDAALIDPNVS
ncbi:MAG: hypothetical protein AAGG50_10100 [Bacteroidota bacterium]